MLEHWVFRHGHQANQRRLLYLSNKVRVAMTATLPISGDAPWALEELAHLCGFSQRGPQRKSIIQHSSSWNSSHIDKPFWKL